MEEPNKQSIKKQGRPSKYKPEYDKEIIKFFTREPKKGAILPTFSGFADKIDVNEDTIVEWAKVHPTFSASYYRSKRKQKDFLNTMALLGYYNPYYTKFVAINVTDMVDKKEIDTKHSGVVATTELSCEQRKLIAQQILNES